MASGYTVSPDILKMFKFLKNRKDLEGNSNRAKSPRYFTMVLDIEKSEIVMGDIYIRTNSCEDDLQQFIEQLPPEGAVFALFDFEFDSSDGKREKPVFIQWVPDCCKTKTKMLMASSAHELKKKFDGLGAILQVCEACDLQFDLIKEKIKQ